MLSKIVLSILIILIIVLIFCLVVVIINQQHEIAILRSNRTATTTRTDDVTTRTQQPPTAEHFTIRPIRVTARDLGAIFTRLNTEIDRVIPPTPPQPPPTPQAPIEHADYFENLQHENHNNDTQNVHNSQIVKELKKKYKRLLVLNNQTARLSDVRDALNGIPDDILKNAVTDAAFDEMGKYLITIYDDFDTADREKILKVVETAQKGNEFIGFSDGETPEHEDWILAQVWIRINHVDNAERKSELLTSFIDQLKDASKEVPNLADAILIDLANIIQPGLEHPQPRQVLVTECIQGRISRYLQTFTMLDADPELAEPVKDEKEYENEAYMKSSNLLQKNLTENPDMATLYNTMEDELNETDHDLVRRFKDEIKKQIETVITQDYRDIIPDRLEALITKCKDGV